MIIRMPFIEVLILLWAQIVCLQQIKAFDVFLAWERQ